MKTRGAERHLLSDYSLEELEELIESEEQAEKEHSDSGFIKNKSEEIRKMEDLRLKQIKMNMTKQKMEFQEEQDELKTRQSIVLQQRNKLKIERDNIAGRLENDLQQVSDNYSDSHMGDKIKEEQASLEESTLLLEKIEKEIKNRESEINSLAKQEKELLESYREREREIIRERKRLEAEEEARIREYREKLKRIKAERLTIEQTIKEEQQIMDKRDDAKRAVKQRRALVEEDIRLELEKERHLRIKANKLSAENKKIEEKRERDIFSQNRSTHNKQESVISNKRPAYNEQPNQERQSETTGSNRLDAVPGGVASFLEDRNEMIDRGDYEDIEESLYQDDVNQGIGLIGRLKNIFK